MARKKFTVTVLPDATRNRMGVKKQKIRRVRRPAITYNANRHEEMIWLRLR